MRKLALFLFCLVSPALFAQKPHNESLKGQPIEINSTGGTQYHDNVATARGNVAIHVGDTDVYGDEGEYNTETHIVRVTGNVRIYRGTEIYVGESGTYNTDTQEITASQLRSLEFPYFLDGETVDRTSGDENKDGETLTLVHNGYFTTHDALNPDFRLKAKTIRVYEDDHIVFENMIFYIGKIPIFYFPYLYQSLDDAFSFIISPAYTSSWGPSLLSRVSFPIGKRIKAIARLDYRVRRGVALGFQADMKYGVNDTSRAKLNTYFLRDQNPLINRTSLPRGSVPTTRYRLSLDDRTVFGHEITGYVHATKLSDRFVLQDFFQNEFRVTPQPDNLVSLNRYSPNYSLTAFARVQLNDFFEATERLPDISLDIKRQPVLGSGIFYEGEASLANLRRNFETNSVFQDYQALRLDTFHQFTYPNTYFGWLSVVPRIGFRATYYSESRDTSHDFFAADPNPLVPIFTRPLPTVDNPLPEGGALVRTVVNTGVEASFKVSRTWEDAQSRFLGLDGLRHIVQPFMNMSYVAGDNTDPARILQFDRLIPSTQLQPIDFPQFTSIDSIDNWSIMRLGVRNRLQTRRDDNTINWMELQTYFDVNFDNPYDRRDFSGLYNRFGFAPVPWFGIGIGSQLPVFGRGYTEWNTDVHFQPVSNVNLTLSHRFLTNNPFFPDSSLYTAGGYYRVNDNWGVGAYARYEANTGFLEEQRYSLHRDLTSWVASLTTVIRNNGNVKEYGVLLTFTLKALPKVSFDANFDPGGTNDPTQP